MQYINPYELLGITAENLSEVSGVYLNRAKRKLLAELELSDTNTIVHLGVELNKGDCLRAIDDLDDKDKKEFHFFIYQHKYLERFLANGELSFFYNYQVESIYKQKDFLEFISQYFTEQYDKILFQNYKLGDREAVAQILSVKPITNETYYEKCYRSTYSYVKDIDNEINDIIKDIANKQSLFIRNEFRGLDNAILEKINVPSLNLLPSYFQILRNQLAFSIRNLAVDINNDPYNYYEPAFKVVDIANNILTDSLTKQSITKNFYIIKKNYDGYLARLQFQKQTGAQNQVLTEWKNIEIQIESITKEIVDGVSRFISLDFFSLDSLIIQIVNTPKINALSSDFQSIRNRVADKVRTLAKIVNNDPYRNYRVAFSLIDIAAKIKTDGNVAEIIINTYQSIKRNFDRQINLSKNQSKSKYNTIPNWTTINEKEEPIHKKKSNLENIINLKPIVLLRIAFVALIVIVFFAYIFNDETTSSTTTTSKTNSSNFKISPDIINSKPIKSFDPISKQAEKGFVPPEVSKPVYNFPFIANGNLTGCSNIRPRYDKAIDNELIISCGNNADAAVKMIDYSTDKSIRYVYICKNSTYTIRNIPQGRYYLKIAYGEDWGVKAGESNCNGRFTTHSLYKKGDKILDFNKIDHGDGTYGLPSFSLKLNVIYTTNDGMNTFTTNKISENEFYNE